MHLDRYRQFREETVEDLNKILDEPMMQTGPLGAFSIVLYWVVATVILWARMTFGFLFVVANRLWALFTFPFFWLYTVVDLTVIMTWVMIQVLRSSKGENKCD